MPSKVLKNFFKSVFPDRRPGPSDFSVTDTNLEWTKEAVVALAREFRTRSLFAESWPEAFNAAKKNGWLDVVHEAIGYVDPRFQYSDDDLLSVAERYKSQREFIEKERQAYNCLVRRRLLDRACEHMEKSAGISDNNAIYIWRVVGQYFNGKPVYKLGITSARLGMLRITTASKRNEMLAELILLAEVDCSARELELVLHSLGENPHLTVTDGGTEFRALSDPELQEAVNLVHQYTVPIH